MKKLALILFAVGLLGSAVSYACSTSAWGGKLTDITTGADASTVAGVAQGKTRR